MKKFFRTIFIVVFCIAMTTACEKGYYGENDNGKTVTPNGNNGDNGNDNGDSGNDSGNTGGNDGTGGNDNGGTDGGGTEPGGGTDTGDNGDGGNDNGSDNGGSDDGDGDIDGERVFTVGQFINYELTGQRWVRGYIVGACTRKIENADFDPPFTYPQAILLADSPTERSRGNVISICLPSGSKYRKELNLVDNPKNYRRRVAIFGEQATYLGITGIKKPDGWMFD